MGTSKGYAPPTGYLWTESKRAVTKMVKSGFSPDAVGKAVSGFAKAIRGGGGESTISRSAISVGSRAISFISSVNKFGFNTSLENAGLSHLTGLSSNELRAELIEYFIDSGNSLYESVAKQSMNELMRELLKSAVNLEDFNEVFESLNPGEFMREYLIKFIQNCFFTNYAEKMLGLFENLDQYPKAEKSVKTYIRNTLESDLSISDIQSIDWAGNQGERIIQEKCDKALRLLSVWSESLV